MLPAQWNPDSDNTATDTPAQAEADAPPQSGAAATQSQSQINPTAAAPGSLSSTVQSVFGKSTTTRAATRDTKQQMVSNAATISVISNPAAFPPPAVTALPSSIPQQDSAAQALTANPLPIPQQDLPVQAVTASPSAIPHLDSAAQADPKLASSPVDPTKETNKSQTEITVAPSADAASVHGTPQASADQFKADAQAAKSASTQEAPAGALSSSDSTAGVTAAALGNGIAAADAMQSALSASIAPLPAIGDTFQLPDTASQAKSSAASASTKALTGVNGSGDGKDKQSDAATASPSPSAHNSTSSNQPVQRTDSNFSHAAPDTSKPASSSAQQVQGIAVQGAPRAAEPASGRTGEVPQPARSAGQEALAQASETSATSVVNTASVMQKMSGTEMRVAVHSTDFGAVSIRTSLSEQQMTTQITVDHSDLGRALSAHASAMENRLGNQLGVRALVQVNQSAMSFSGEGGNSPRSGQKSLAASQGSNEIAPALAESDDPGVYGTANAAGVSRLDIRA